MPKETISKLKRRALSILRELVTVDGIYASTDNGWKGSFHALFGRDSAITAWLIFSVEPFDSRSGDLPERAYQGLLKLSKWQGHVNNSATGEEIGKIPHEIRSGDSTNSETEARLVKYSSMWFWDPKDQLYKSWDSVDSTPLWILAIIRYHKSCKMDYQPDVLSDLKSALTWCLNNLKQYGGLAGFTGSDLKPERTATGLHNQSWKDNDGSYQYEDGTFAKHPIYDVFVNGLFWAALKYGAELFEAEDQNFSAELRLAADKLKARFNDPDIGFLMKSQGLSYFAEALDGDGQQLQGICVDVGMCLSASYDGECIIEERFLADVVERLMMPDMFNNQAGMRDYSKDTEVKVLFAGGYHRGPNTYWPFVSGLVVNGFNNFGFKAEAHQVAEAALKGLDNFDSCIEVYIEEKSGVLAPWHHPAEKQQSATNQAWTAAAMDYLASLLD